MATFLEDFSRWDWRELIDVPPESLEYADLVALVIELQKRYEKYVYLDKEGAIAW